MLLDGPTIERTCTNCKAGFTTLVSEVKRGGGKFCCLSCAYQYRVGANNPNWRGGISADAYHYTKARWLKFPDHVITERKALAAKNAGKLVPEPCESCGSSIDIEMHHDDYSRPLQVRWMCTICHGRYHANLRKRVL
jgi:hypothetical protein